MASNKKKRNTNQASDSVKAQVDFFEEEDFSGDTTAADRRARRDEKAKQRKEDRQNMLLLIGVVAVLAIVGIVIWITSGSDGSSKGGEAVAVASTEETAVAEAGEEAPQEEAVEAAGEEAQEEAVEAAGEEAQEEEAAEAGEEEEPLELTVEEEPAEEAAEEPAEEAAEEAAATEETGEEVTSSTVLEAGTVYSVENTMPLYEEASTDSTVVMELQAGWSVAVENAAEAGNGWHYVSVWLGGQPTYGYIQIP